MSVSDFETTVAAITPESNESFKQTFDRYTVADKHLSWHVVFIQIGPSHCDIAPQQKTNHFTFTN